VRSADFVALVKRAAQRLHESGIGAGDLVLYQGAQSIDALVLFWACQWLGAVFAPVDGEWPEYLIARATGALAPKLVVAAPARFGVFRQLFPAALLIGLPDDAAAAPLERPSFRAWLEQPGRGDGPPEQSRVDAGSAALYLFTSGSTGTPKIVVHSRRGLLHGGRLTLATFGWGAGEHLINLPEPHTMSGLRNAFVAAPLGGLVLHPVPPDRRRNIFSLIAEISESGCERLVVGPALVRQLVLMGDRLRKSDLANLKAIYSTGATLNAQAAERFFERYRIPIVNYYGLTETGGLCVSQSPTGWRPDDHSLGVPVGCQARIVPTGASGDGDIGELQIQSPQLMTGYLNDPERTAARFDGPWVRTGDVVRRDGEGRIHLAGRSDLFIKTAATERVHPEEIETVLEEHDGIAEAAVVGVRTDQDVERVTALVVLSDPQSQTPELPRQLVNYVAERLGSARAPTEIRFVSQLPRLTSGKLERRRLGELLS